MGTFSRRQLPTAKRTGKRQGRFRRRGVNRNGRGAFGGWVLSVVMDKKKEGRPFRAGPLWLGSVKASLSVLLHYSTLRRCCQQLFGGGWGFRWLLHPCCLRASPRGALPPTGGRGWAPAGLVALQVTTLRAACGVAAIRAGRQRSRWWPAGPLRFRRGWAFRCLTTSGGCGVSVAATATGRSP